MVYHFEGIKESKTSDGYYYSQDEVKLIQPPLLPAEGEYILSESQLKSIFGIEQAKVAQVPEVLFTPKLDSSWDTSRSKRQGENWWDITGEVVAYKPIAWVPRVTLLETIPKSEIETEFKATSTKVEASKIYGKVTSKFKVSGEGGMYGAKLEASVEAEAGVSYEVNNETRQEVTQKAKMGGHAIKRIVVAMILRVERVFERGLSLYYNNSRKSWSLTWDGGDKWDDIWIKSSWLRSVEPLQYVNMQMTGGGYTQGLHLQLLPVLDSHKKVTDIHLVVSTSGWENWYVYTGGAKNSSPNQKEDLAIPGTSQPTMSLIAANDES